MLKNVQISCEYSTTITVEDGQSIDDAIFDIDIPENESMKYKEDSFEEIERKKISHNQTTVKFCCRFLAAIDCSEYDSNEEAISDLDIPESESVIYVSDSLEIVDEDI